MGGEGGFSVNINVDIHRAEISVVLMDGRIIIMF